MSVHESTVTVTLYSKTTVTFSLENWFQLNSWGPINKVVYKNQTKSLHPTVMCSSSLLLCVLPMSAEEAVCLHSWAQGICHQNSLKTSTQFQGMTLYQNTFANTVSLHRWKQHMGDHMKLVVGISLHYMLVPDFCFKSPKTLQDPFLLDPVPTSFSSSVFSPRH